MKKIVIFILLSLVLHNAYSQNSGKPIAEIYTNFHYSLDTMKTTGFGIDRAFLGYNFPANENFSATILLNLGNPEDLAAGNKPRRLAHIREAFITYQKEKLTVNFGITKTLIADYQNRFLEKRYIAEVLLTGRGFGHVSDLGISALYKFSDVVSADFSIMNGKGYTAIQSDNHLKTAGGVYITPGMLALRLFGDVMKKGELWQSTMVGFAGFKNKQLTLGAEMSYKNNFGSVEGTDAWGFSGIGSFYITPKFDLFARYDYFTSVKTGSDTEPWNYHNDSDILITGAEYSFTDKIKVSLNFQGSYPHDSQLNGSELIFLNSLFRF